MPTMIPKTAMFPSGGRAKRPQDRRYRPIPLPLQARPVSDRYVQSGGWAGAGYTKTGMPR